MPRNKREPWLDWDNSLAEVEELKRKREHKKSIKSLFWARFWLVLGLGFFSNLYLRRPLAAFLWLLILFAYGLFSTVLSEFAKVRPSKDFFLVIMVNLMLYLVMITVEWVQLPKRVRKLNTDVVGENNLDNDELRGKIGRYSILKKHTYALLIAYVLSILVFEIEESMSSIYTNTLSICLLIIVQVLAFSYLYRAYKLSQQSDINLESRDK